MKHIISLGAGVQSSTMALMAAHGEITPMPDAAIFADTQDEPKSVYEHLAWLQGILPYPVYIVSAGKLSQRHLDGFNGARTPFYIAGGGMAKRQCTREFKIRPLRRKAREILGVGTRSHIAANSVSKWVGISTDEIWRQKPSGVRWEVNRWPLIEANMSREDCVRWLAEKYGRSAPKSACKQCPYQEPERLLRLKEDDPEGFAELCDYDAALRTPERIARWRGELYVHSSCVPLVQIDLSAEVAKRAERVAALQAKRAAALEILAAQGNMFTNECEGMCGI